MTNLDLDRYPTPLELSLWIVVVAAGGTGAAHIEFYQSRVVAYTKQEAIAAVLKQMASETPQLYAKGAAMGGWRVTHIDGMSAEQLTNAFKDRADLERKLESERVHLEQNNLIRQILDTKDVAIFHQAIREGRLSNYERLYIHDKLTTGIDTNIPENLVSPIQP